MFPAFWKYLLISDKRKKYVSMWVDIASQMDNVPFRVSYAELCSRHDLSRSGLHRHLEEVRQFWDKDGTNLGQSWDRGGIVFESVTTKTETKVKQTWDKPETKVKQEKPKNQAGDNDEVIAKIIGYLNQKTGKRYRSSNKKTKTFIEARLKDGYTFDDFCKVIDNKYERWKGTEQEIYLRPETLFGNRFDSYLNETPRNPHLFMHQKIANHATKTERYNDAISEAGAINFGQFVEFDEGDQGDS